MIMKILKIIALAGALATGTAWAKPTSDFYPEARAATYQVEAHFEHGAVDVLPNIGTGVMVSKHLLLTANHTVVGANGGLSIKKHGTEVAQAKVLYQDAHLDLAVLYVPLDCPCVPLSSRAAFVDEKVFTVGYALGLAEMITVGEVSGHTKYFDRIPLLVASVSLAPGNSGGGLFAVVNGELRLVSVALAMPGNQVHSIHFIGLFSTYDNMVKVLSCVLPDMGGDWCTIVGGDDAERHEAEEGH